MLHSSQLPSDCGAPRLRRSAAGALAALLIAVAAPARDRSPGFERVALELPGIPAAIESADVDGDGRRDLVVVVAYTEWGDVAEFEEASFDGVEGLVEVMTVVSALLDRRELRVYPGAPDGGFGDPLPPLELDNTLHSLQAVNPTHGERPARLVGVTDDGTVEIAIDRAAATLTLAPGIEATTRFAGDGRFYADLDLLHDLDGDTLEELVLPTAEGWSIYRGTATGFEDTPRARLTLPAEPADEPNASEEDDGETENDTRSRLRAPSPQVRDLTADGRPELLLLFGDEERTLQVYENLGGLRFAAARELEAPTADVGAPAAAEPNEGEPDEEEHSESIVYAGDLDGDGRAVAIGRRELSHWDDEDSVRQELEAVKRPRFSYRLYSIRPDLSLAPASLDFEATGYILAGTDSDDEEVTIHLPGGFRDLDGDGREDLVTVTLDFSIVPLLSRALITQRLKLTLDFHAWCQQSDGTFAEVSGLDLSGTFKINLRNARVRHLSQFAGDFDGDGRADFVQLGRGRKVTIHHGEPGCRYPTEPDRTLVLERKPRHLGFVRVLDLDGDERSDLYVVHPLAKPHPERSIPTRVDLYLSRD